MLARILIAAQVDARPLSQALARGDWLVETWDGKADLVDLVRRHPADLVVVEARALASPEAFVASTQELPGAPGVLVLCASESADEGARLLAAGAAGVLGRAVAIDAVRDVARAILERRAEAVTRELAARRGVEEPRLADFASSSPTMAAFMRLVERVARSDASLLVLGETGVGKERLARAIHAEGERAGGPFVAINCGALPEALLESELLGHTQGAFTGANRDRRGLFELAHRGTVFLDEIGDLPLHLQVKLLRVLQDHAFKRLGGESDITVDIRVIAATNADLEALVEAKHFRQDLYYRLSVVTLTVPPLRERREDIPKLVETYVAQLGSVGGGQVARVAEDALERLVAYAWPGNVRELINVIERAVLLAEGEVIGPADLPAAMRGQAAPAAGLGARGAPEAGPELGAWLQLPLGEARERLERAYLLALLKTTRGRIDETAARAGLSVRVLHAYMKRHGLRKETFRPA